jgi:membrane AbrB-like protein
MPRRPRLSDRRARIAATAALGTAGGAAAAAIGMPLPWMLGPMSACAAAALAGLPVAAPQGLRPVVIPVIGVMLGAGFSPEILGQLGAWAGTFVALPPFLAVAGAASWLFYTRIGGYDARTAFFCAAPGGLNEMILMGEEAGGDPRRIALAHAVRIFCVIMAIALAFALFGGTTTAGMAGNWTAFSDLPAGEAAALLGCAVLGTPLARLARLPAAGLFGPMVLSAGLHLSGLVTAPPPSLLVILAQLVIGTILGSRFAGARLAETGRDLALGVGATLVLLAVTVVFALALGRVTVAPWGQAMLAFAPGGLAEMSLLALAKGQDVAYVATAHVARIAVVVIAVRPLFGAIGARLDGPQGADPQG